MTKARTLADNYAADINQITATSPLTGGGTSGTVTVGIQAGTTSQSGAVQLTDSTASTSTTNAATPNSVKSAYDLANAAVAKSTIDAKGDLLVGTANDTVGRLAVASTAGYLLTVDSAEATGLKWAAPAGGGKVLQVVQATTVSGTTTNSQSYVDTALSASITPSSTSSKVLVMLTQNVRATPSGGSYNDIGGNTRLVRGSTQLALCFAPTMYISQSLSGSEVRASVAISYLDSPSTTSSTTYKPQINATYSNNTYEVLNAQTIILMEIGA